VTDVFFFMPLMPIAIIDFSTYVFFLRPRAEDSGDFVPGLLWISVDSSIFKLII
tara:strand:- start:71 stop:232 length:162 start_codon:yes stop_codon:yes gene_type:complete